MQATDGRIDSGANPGLAVLVIRNGVARFQQCAGLADLQRQTPIDAVSLLEQTSATKPFTALANCAGIDIWRMLETLTGELRPPVIAHGISSKHADR